MDKDKKELAKDLKTIYEVANEEDGYKNMETISENWKEKYPAAMKSWKVNLEAISPIEIAENVV